MYMSLGSSAATVFSWFVNITTVAGLIGWIVIGGTYLRFYACLKKQGFSRHGMLHNRRAEIDADHTSRTSLPHTFPAVYRLGDHIHGRYDRSDFRV